MSRSSRLREPIALDTAALLAFVAIGLASHRHALNAGGVARDVLPLLGGWFGAALLFRLYPNGDIRRLLATWAVGVPAAVLVRALALGRDLDSKQFAFLIVSLVMTLLLVSVGRSIPRLIGQAT